MKTASGIMVRLSPSEMYSASIVGLRRHLVAISRGFRDRNGADSMSAANAYFAHINGAQGEIAAAKAIGLYWPASVNARKIEPDLPPDWQVRTRIDHTYDLIVRSDDIDSHRYILVTGTGPEFLVHGWMLGSEAKRQEWLKDRGGRNSPCYWVPQGSLNPFP